MIRYRLNDKGINEIKGFIFEHGNDDYLDCYLLEAESIADHAFNEGVPAVLSVESFSDDARFNLTMPKTWFKEEQRHAE
jgi:hypothetical protein